MEGRISQACFLCMVDLPTFDHSKDWMTAFYLDTLLVPMKAHQNFTEESWGLLQVYNTPRFLIGIMLHVFRLSWEDGPQWSNAQAKLPRVFWLRPRLFSGTIEDEAKIETLKKRHGDLTCFSWYPLVINTHKYQYQILHCWLVVWNILYFSIYWE